MNTSALKAFAPAVRKQLMDAVSIKLDFALAAATPDYLATYAPQVRALRELAAADRTGLVERVAYTWFNRLAALRYLDARNWHPFPARVLMAAGAEHTLPELFTMARTGAVPEELRRHVDVARMEAILQGRIPSADPQGEAYRMLVLAACRFYHQLLPDVFERLDDETELLLPDDLLTQQSVAQGFRTEITDEDCEEVEVLGWLYQFYISEKKDEVMARKAVVPADEIPAVTQLFTPHWIVRYLVENSLGRLWIMNRPDSLLRAWMPYYVETEAETEFLRIGSPQEIRVCDPAAGSGHMLTYGFDLLYVIYEEEGFAPSDIPELILQHNLYGAEIDCRASQLAALALTLKAREKNPRFFHQDRFVRPRIVELLDLDFEQGDLEAYSDALGLGDLFSPGLLKLLKQFQHAKNLGSLIEPCLSEREISFARGILEARDLGSNLFLHETHVKVLRVLEQAEILTQRYHVVVANPPYMGSGNMNHLLKTFAKAHYEASRSDLFTMFIDRAFRLTCREGLIGMVTMQAWMFLSSYQQFREELLNRATITTLAQIGYNSFPEMNSKIAQACAFILFTSHRDKVGRYFNLNDAPQAANKDEVFLSKSNSREMFLAPTSHFQQLPGSVIAYWLSDTALDIFRKGERLETAYQAKSGVMTGDDEFFLYSWHEVSHSSIGFGYLNESDIQPQHSFFPMNKEDSFRKWSGCFTTVFRYVNHGEEHSQRKDLNYRLRDKELYFKAGISWSDVTSGPLSFRYQPTGFIFAARAPTIFTEDRVLLAFLNSKLTVFFGAAINPTLSFNLVDLYDLPLLKDEIERIRPELTAIADRLVSLSTDDWDNCEGSWRFKVHPFISTELKADTLEATWLNWRLHTAKAIDTMRELETESNRLLIDAYGLQNELQSDVSEDQVTLARADSRRDVAGFLSYAIGCMMGRYSLDCPGLILADAGDGLPQFSAKLRKSSLDPTFTPNDDGIIPVLGGEWFADDIVGRTREFVRATFGEGALRDSIRFIEESLGRDLRNYFLTDFYKDHLQIYKKRPIYWMVQSPRKGFSVLIYLHRYTRDTMNVILNRYLRDFQVKLRSRIDHLAGVQTSTSAPVREKTVARKESDKLTRTLHECQEWERQTVLPLAQARIELDLDDGVKVNYLKLGEALAPIPGFAAAEE